MENELTPPAKSLQEHDIQEPEQILRDVLYKHGFVYSDFQWRYVVAHRHIELEAMKLYASQFKTQPVQEDQDELWRDVLRGTKKGSMEDIIENWKSKYTIIPKQ